MRTTLFQVTPSGAAGLAFAALVFVFVPMLAGQLWLSVFISTACFTLAVAGVAFMYARLGMVSLTQVGLMGVGGWIMLRLNHAYALPFEVNLVIATLGTTALGFVMALPALQMRGLYLALVTLMAAGGLDEVLAETYALFPELAERKGQLAGTMSGGQQQMLALGHALMSRSKFMLIDEMSLGLAPLVVKRLAGFVQDLKARGVGVLLIEQFTEMALSLAENAVILRAGAVRYSGRAAQLVAQPELLDQAYFGIDAAEQGAHVGAG